MHATTKNTNILYVDDAVHVTHGIMSVSRCFAQVKSRYFTLSSLDDVSLRYRVHRHSLRIADSHQHVPGELDDFGESVFRLYHSHDHRFRRLRGRQMYVLCTTTINNKYSERQQYKHSMVSSEQEA